MAIVIVSGGAGFIGSHTVEALEAEGYDVIVIDNLYSGNTRNLLSTRATLLIADVADSDEIASKIYAKVKPGDVEAVIHLAAITNVVEASVNPYRTFKVNVEGTANLLEIARRLDVERFVYASSVAVYGEPRYLPINEKHPLEPVNFYGFTKLVGERLIWYWHEIYGIKTVALRYFNVYGPRMRPGHYAGVVYSFLKRLMQGLNPIIYGDGSQTRDFVYVKDVARANLLALKTRYVGALNICTGVETSVIELYMKICSLLGYCISPRFAPPRSGDVKRSAGDCSLARQVLGWEPLYDLDSGLRETLDYYKDI